MTDITAQQDQVARVRHGGRIGAPKHIIVNAMADVISGMRQQDVAAKYGYSVSTIAKWVADYKMSLPPGAEIKTMVPHRRKRPKFLGKAKKARALSELQQGVGIQQVAETYGVSTSAVAKWKTNLPAPTPIKAAPVGIEVSAPLPQSDLERRVRLLENEIMFLRNKINLLG